MPINKEKMEMFIRALPKAENHLHAEGALYPETILKLAAKHGMKLPYGSVEEAEAYYEFASLGEFLDAFFIGCTTLIDAEDFETMVVEYAKHAKAQNIVLVEMMVTFAAHLSRGVKLETIVKGLSDGRKKAMEEYGVKMIFSAEIDRTISSQESLDFVKKIIPYRDELALFAIGLDFQEKGYPASVHKPAFDYARENGLVITNHAGEDDGPESVWDSLSCNCSRIDHGVHSISDPALCEALRDKKISLTICPISNEFTKSCLLKDSPIIKFRDMGILVSINSDDPPFFSADLIDNFMAVQQTFSLTADELVQLVKNAYYIATISEAERDAYLADVDRAAQSFVW